MKQTHCGEICYSKRRSSVRNYYVYCLITFSLVVGYENISAHYHKVFNPDHFCNNNTCIGTQREHLLPLEMTNCA